MSVGLRPFATWDDLGGMRQVVAEGLSLAPDRSYVHPGDVTWWLSWPPTPVEAIAERAAVWEEDARIEGLVVIDERDVGSFVRPRWLDDRRADAFEDAVEAWLREREVSPIRYLADDDDVAVARLRRLGYGPADDGMRVFWHDLAGLPPAHPRSRVRALRFDDDSAGRASVERAAFGSDRPLERYVEDYRIFMGSPFYPLGWDLVAETEDGEAAACCIAWPDTVSRMGNFEPVATHPSHARQGFATMAMQEGLRRFAAEGMTTVIVRTPIRNDAAAALYLSLGFVERPLQRAFVPEGHR